MNIISSNKLNKSKQKKLDDVVNKYGNFTYYDLYDAILKLNYKHLEKLISFIIDYEMESVMESFWDINKLPEELFQKEELFNRPYYLGVDFSRGTDVIGEITYK